MFRENGGRKPSKAGGRKEQRSQKRAPWGMEAADLSRG